MTRRIILVMIVYLQSTEQTNKTNKQSGPGRDNVWRYEEGDPGHGDKLN